MEKMEKLAVDWLPQDLQDAINSFIEQFNIMVEYDLPEIPFEYGSNLISIMSKYPEHNKLTLDLMKILSEEPRLKGMFDTIQVKN